MKGTIGHAVVLASLLSLCACPPAPVPPSPDDDIDAAGANPSCANYCTHARDLHCKQGNPTAKGATCETICDNVQKNSGATIDLRCGYRAKTCDAISACDR